MRDGESVQRRVPPYPTRALASAPPRLRARRPGRRRNARVSPPPRRPLPSLRRRAVLRRTRRAGRGERARAIDRVQRAVVRAAADAEKKKTERALAAQPWPGGVPGRRRPRRRARRAFQTEIVQMVSVERGSQAMYQLECAVLVAHGDERRGTRARAAARSAPSGGGRAAGRLRRPRPQTPRACRWNTCRAWTTSPRWWTPRTTPRAASPLRRSCSPRIWRAWRTTWSGTPTARWPSADPGDPARRRRRGGALPAARDAASAQLGPASLGWRRRPRGGKVSVLQPEPSKRALRRRAERRSRRFRSLALRADPRFFSAPASRKPRSPSRSGARGGGADGQAGGGARCRRPEGGAAMRSDYAVNSARLVMGPRARGFRVLERAMRAPGAAPWS